MTFLKLKKTNPKNENQHCCGEERADRPAHTRALCSPHWAQQPSR